MSVLAEARTAFHNRLIADSTLSVTDGVASNADGSQRTSKDIAGWIATKLNANTVGKKIKGQTAGKQFEEAVTSFLEDVFPRLQSVRPGTWDIENVGGTRGSYHIARYEPYSHLDDLARAVKDNPTLETVLGNSYDISPDVMVLRRPEKDSVFNMHEAIVDDSVAKYSPLRERGASKKIVHAIVSCKWTLRSDRAQNARAEALGAIRNRKGRAPHIVVVTAEPSPSRLASLALGTGDIDTIYHFALTELQDAVKNSGNDEAVSMLNILVGGHRLRDISDLPLDLCI